MIDTFLMSIAVASGAIQFEERPTDVRMFAKAFGVKITLASVPKEYLAELLAQTADGSVAPVQAAKTRPPAETPPQAQPVRQRPQLRLVVNE